MYSNILRILIVFVSAVLLPATAVAQKYTILLMNANTETASGLVLKRGDKVDPYDIKSIKWSSPHHVVKVMDRKTGRPSTFTQRNVNKTDETRSLSRYLTREKSLLTRGWTSSDADSLVQLADTVTFNIADLPHSRNILYIATCTDGNFRERTKLPMSADGSILFLTRDIYGHHEPPHATMYVTILRYDLTTNEAPENLGYLHVEALPLTLE